MTRREMEQRAFELHNGGFHCAEAVLLAITSHFGGLPEGMPPRMATCFGGGVGKTHEELCGALAGGLIALGCLRGRDKQGMDWDCAARLAATFREEFVTKHGSSVCRNVLATLGQQENFNKCKLLSADTAGLAFELLQEEDARSGAGIAGCESHQGAK